MTWKLVKLGDVCHLKNGFAFKSKLFKDKGLPILRISNIQNERIDIRKTVYFNAKDYNLDLKKYEVKTGDLLIAMSGATTGKIGFNESQTTFYLNQRVGKLVPGKDLDKKYLYYLLSTKVEENLKISKGAAQPNLSSEQIKNIEISLPSIPEQQSIVAKLDAAFAEIDKTEKNYNKKKIELDLVKSNFLLTKVSQVKNSKLYILDDICKKITDGSHNPPKVSKESSYMMLSSRNIFDDSINYEKPRFINKQSFYSENKRTDVQKNDVLLTIVGTIGRCAVVKSDDVKFTLQRSVAVFKPNDLVKSRFLMYLLQSLILEFKKKSAGVAQQGIYLKQLKNTKVKIPPLDKQKSLVNDIDNFYNQLEELNKIFSKQKSNFASLKLSILSQEIKNKAA